MVDMVEEEEEVEVVVVVVEEVEGGTEREVAAAALEEVEAVLEAEAARLLASASPATVPRTKVGNAPSRTRNTVEEGASAAASRTTPPRRPTRGTSGPGSLRSISLPGEVALVKEGGLVGVEVEAVGQGLARTGAPRRGEEVQGAERKFFLFLVVLIFFAVFTRCFFFFFFSLLSFHLHVSFPVFVLRFC